MQTCVINVIKIFNIKNYKVATRNDFVLSIYSKKINPKFIYTL